MYAVRVLCFASTRIVVSSACAIASAREGLAQDEDALGFELVEAIHRAILGAHFGPCSGRRVRRSTNASFLRSTVIFSSMLACRASMLRPALTTVRQPFDAVAQEGLKRLVHAIENPEADPLSSDGPPIDLIVRESTAPPNGGSATSIRLPRSWMRFRRCFWL